MPGRDPADIDLRALHELVVLQKLPVGQAAGQLRTTTYHVRFALESIPRAARQWGRSTPPSAWILRHQAPQILTREFFEREYLQAGKRLQQIAAETGFYRPLAAHYAHKAGISLAHSPPPKDIDKDWLREQYLDRQRPYADIAAELGVAVMTVYDAARRYGITSRAPGVHSSPQMITKLGKDSLRDVRRAVEGGLQGWHRLRRFQIAMTFPTIEAAATSLGAHQSALVHQLRRLERDIGATLYHPSTPASRCGQPAAGLRSCTPSTGPTSRRSFAHTLQTRRRKHAARGDPSGLRPEKTRPSTPEQCRAEPAPPGRLAHAEPFQRLLLRGSPEARCSARELLLIH